MQSWLVGTPTRTRLSTNGTCQLEKTENLASKGTRRARYAARQHFTPRIEEKAKNRNTCQMFGITVRFRGDAMLSTKVPCEFEANAVAPQECGFATFSPSGGIGCNFSAQPLRPRDRSLFKGALSSAAGSKGHSLTAVALQRSFSPHCSSFLLRWLDALIGLASLKSSHQAFISGFLSSPSPVHRFPSGSLAGLNRVRGFR